MNITLLYNNNDNVKCRRADNTMDRKEQNAFWPDACRIPYYVIRRRRSQIMKRVIHISSCNPVDAFYLSVL